MSSSFDAPHLQTLNSYMGLANGTATAGSSRITDVLGPGVIELAMTIGNGCVKSRNEGLQRANRQQPTGLASDETHKWAIECSVIPAPCLSLCSNTSPAVVSFT